MKRGRKRLHINRLTRRMDEMGITYPELGEKLGISLKSDTKSDFTSKKRKDL